MCEFPRDSEIVSRKATTNSNNDNNGDNNDNYNNIFSNRNRILGFELVPAEIHTPASLWKAGLVTTDGAVILLVRLLPRICLEGSKLSHFLRSNFHCHRHVFPNLKNSIGSVVGIFCLARNGKARIFDSVAA